MQQKRNTLRGAVALLAGMLLALGSGMAQAADPVPRVGVQLWSVKDALKQDFDGTLAKLAAMGFAGVEFAGELGPYAHDAPRLRRLLDKNGLQCAGAHLRLATLEGTGFDSASGYYRTLGCPFLIVAMDQRAASLDGAAAVARDLARLSPRLAPLGMAIGYHNHGEEMAGADGHTPWDVIAAGTPPATVLQQDLGWTTYAGKDPLTLIRRYPGRSQSLHFKAKLPKGVPGTPLIGRDGSDWGALAAAARHVGGTAWIIVEQEEYPDGLAPLDAVAASLRGLQAVLGK